MAQAPQLSGELKRLRDGGPYRSRRSLNNVNGTITVSIMKDAWEDSQHSLDDPGEVDTWYYPDRGILLVDLEE